MIKKLLIFLFLTLYLTSSAQEAGILIKTTLDPFMGWNGSHAGSHRITVGATTIAKSSNTNDEVVIEYDFFYVNDNPTYISCVSTTAGNKDDNDCKIGVDPLIRLPYNKTTFGIAYFGGCIADSEIMGIYIPEPASDQICASDIMTLKNGWNWQYRFTDGNWQPFPSQYQEKTSISFKIKDLNGFNNQKTIYFQAGYQTKFTNIRPYQIIGCSPEYDGNPVTADAKCIYEASGSVTLKFKSELKDGDRFLFNIFYDKTPPEFIKSVFINKDQIINKTFIWDNLAKGSYIIKYQAQSTTDINQYVGLSAITPPAFTIGSRPALTFTAKEIQPNCNTETGSINITASGGTPPYYYILDNESNKHEFTSPATISNIGEGNHTVKIVDNNNCIEK
jgi:hypothetical protein